MGIEPSYLYIVHVEERETKIGISSMPRKRIGQLRCGNPNIKVQSVFECESRGHSVILEKECHLDLVNSNIFGEWFSIKPCEAEKLVQEAASRIGVSLTKIGFELKTEPKAGRPPRDPSTPAKAQRIAALLGVGRSQAHLLATQPERMSKLQRDHMALIDWLEERAIDWRRIIAP